MLVLNVPYSEKESAKALGARWNPAEKVWMAPGESFDNYLRFRKWIDGSIILPNEMYIVVAKRRCWKCGNETPVICFATKDYFDIQNGCRIQEWRFTRIFSSMPEEILEYAKKQFNFKLKYSNTAKNEYHANCCIICNSLQGNNYLFDEPLDSPLYINSIERAQAVTLYKIPLPYALPVNTLDEFPVVIGSGGVSRTEMTNLIDMYSAFKQVDVF